MYYYFLISFDIVCRIACNLFKSMLPFMRKEEKSMAFQTLKRNHLKRNIVIVLLVLGIISALVLNFTRAKYRTTQSIPLVNGTINYELSDLNLIGVYIEDGDDYKKVDQIPDSGYTFNSEKSYCKIGDEKQNMTITYDMNTKTLTVSPITSKGTKCYLYFDEEPILLVDAIKRDNTINNGTPVFSIVSTTAQGVYKTEDDWGESYYFRGAVENNYVKFAGFYWRIIRINGDGSIRIIFDGTTVHANGESSTDRQISTSAFNSKESDNMYVGYMYTSGQVHGLGTSSTIKGVLDTWYTTNISNKGYSSYISTEAGFCGDRQPSTSTSTSNGSGGTGTTQTYYEAYIRLETNKSPDLKCTNTTDLYTASGSSKGNKALTSPIGLITADEVSMAGGVSGGVYVRPNSSYYLYTGQYYWTLSPYFFNGSYAFAFRVTSDGSLSYTIVNVTNGVRPVLNLSSDVIVKSGNGTASTPYEI